MAGIAVVALLAMGAFLLYPALTGNSGTMMTATNDDDWGSIPDGNVPVATMEDTSIAPTPAAAEGSGAAVMSGAGDYIIYGDRLDNGFEDWSWAVIELENDTPVYEQEYSIAVDTSEAYSAAWLMQPDGAIETEGFSALRFAIHGGDVGGQVLLVGISHDEDFPVSPHGVPLTDYLPEGPPAGIWSEVTIPLTDLEMESETLFSVAFQSDVEGSQPLFYLDDIRLVAAP